MVKYKLICRKKVRRQKFHLMHLYIPEVMKTGSANLKFLCNFSQLSLSNISLFTVLFTAYVGFFVFLACFLVRDMFSSGCRINYPPSSRSISEAAFY